MITLSENEESTLSSKLSDVYSLIKKNFSTQQMLDFLGISKQCIYSRKRRIKKHQENFNINDVLEQEKKQEEVIKDAEFYKHQTSHWKKKHNDLLKTSSLEISLLI